MSAPTIVLVGHCGPDMFMLRGAVSRLAPDSAVETANDTKALSPYLTASNILLVNRVLDGRFSTGRGIELIGELAAAADAPVQILISNYPESQAEAETAGAHPGFGKTALYDDTTAEIIRTALAKAGGAESL